MYETWKNLNSSFYSHPHPPPTSWISLIFSPLLILEPVQKISSH